jgi:hypothetical protein
VRQGLIEIPAFVPQWGSVRKVPRAFGEPVDDAAAMQEVQAAGDVHGNLQPLIVPSILVRAIQRKSLQQVASLQAEAYSGMRHVLAN